MSNYVKLHETIARMLSHFWFKTFGTTGFTFLFFVAYVSLLKHPLFDVTVIPVTWLDRVIGFQPAALPVYLSLWVYVSLPPMLMGSRRDIVSYGWRMATVCLIALTVFLVWPNAVPPANIDWARYPGMAFLKGVDAAGNACPSLHVATAVFTAIWLHYRLRHLDFGAAWCVFNLTWCAGIMYSTMATKQHVAIDVLAGTALATGTAYLTRLTRHAQNPQSDAG
jgi:membrane-associated phospholipid phosphatase